LGNKTVASLVECRDTAVANIGLMIITGKHLTDPRADRFNIQQFNATSTYTYFCVRHKSSLIDIIALYLLFALDSFADLCGLSPVLGTWRSMSSLFIGGLMSALASFNGPYLKAERAKQHIDHLKAIFVDHITANENALRTKGYGDIRTPNGPIGTPLPKHTPTILGDALHNLRATLDHAYCVLVEANGCDIVNHRQAHRIKFPFGNGTKQDLEGSINGHVKLGITPSQVVIDHIFNVIQPYPGGNGRDLLAVHALDIADKHMALLPTEQDVDVHHLETQDGIVISGITFGRATSRGAVVTGNALAFSPGTLLKQDANNQVSFKIVFGRGQPFDGQPIIPMLEKMLGRVVETLKGLETFLPKT
jgi:hypothetical protein